MIKENNCDQILPDCMLMNFHQHFSFYFFNLFILFMPSTLLQKLLKYVSYKPHEQIREFDQMNLLLEKKHIRTPHKQQATLVHTLSKISVKAVKVKGLSIFYSSEIDWLS